IWQPIELYPRELAFYPMGADSILVENTVKAVHSLFALTPSGLAPSSIVAGIDGSSGQFAFSADGKTAVFVNQSLTRPPEIFVKRGSAPIRQLTEHNSQIAQQVRFDAREVTWESTDGVTVSGWLLTPGGHGDAPWPLVTHVHGGPAFPFPNAFAPYFSYWPYP